MFNVGTTFEKYLGRRNTHARGDINVKDDESLDLKYKD